MTGDVTHLQTLTTHASDVNSVDFASDSALITASGDKLVRVWEWRRNDREYVEAHFSPLRGHKYGVTSVKVSPQSSMLASSSIDGTTTLWNLRTGAKIQTVVQPGGESVRICRFSPDSTMLVTAGDCGQVCLWDLVRRRLISSFQKHDGAVHSVCFTPDTNWLVTGCTFGVLNLFSTIEIGNPCRSEGASTATACDSVDDAHDLGVVSCDISDTPETWCPLTVTPDNSDKRYHLVTCGNDHCVKLWEIKAPRGKSSADFERPRDSMIRLKKILERHSSALTCVRFSANGRYIASCGLDKTTVLWETNSAKVLATISGHSRYVACCAFSRDGNLLATGSNDKSVMIWDLTGKLAKDPDDQSSLTVRNTPLPTPLEVINTNPKFEETLEGNGKTENIQVELIETLRGHSGPVNSIAVSMNYSNFFIASGSGDKQIRIWSNVSNATDEDAENGAVEQFQFDSAKTDGGIVFREELFSPLEAHKYGVNHVEFSPCGKLLASCSLDGTTVIWNIENGGETRSTFVNSGYGVRVCRWSPDGAKIATAGDDERATLWSVKNLDILCAFEKHSEAVNALAFTYDSCYLVSACTAGVWKLFDALHENVPPALLTYDHAHDLGAQACDFSPVSADGIIGRETENSDDELQRYLLATGGNDSLVKLWEIVAFDNRGGNGGDTKVDDASKSNAEYGPAVRCTLRNTLTGHGGNVTCVRFSPVHGEILGSVATDKTARIWSAFSAVCLHVLEEHGSLATACTFSRDTSLFVTGSLDRTILVWKMPQHLVSQTSLVHMIRQKSRRLPDWSISDTLKWLSEIGLRGLEPTVREKALTAQRLISFTPEELRTALELEPADEKLRTLAQQLYWLRNAQFVPTEALENEAVAVPHEFLCPVTHEIMREPVQCTDGFTYERAAITEWFLTSGKYTSPITNQALAVTALTPNVPLRNAIYAFLYGDDAEHRKRMVKNRLS